MKFRNKIVALLMAVIWVLFSLYNNIAIAGSRIKDLADVEGIRDNQLIGYGLVVGLQGTGDSLGNSPFTKQSLQSMLERLGVNTRGSNMNTNNVAAVIITANLPPFAVQGTRIDIKVSALGDAKSLEGGTLMVTPLRGADQEVYAVAQGAVAVGGFIAQAKAATASRGIPTSGRISNGALIEREIPFNMNDFANIRLSLKNSDLTTAKRMVSAINRFVGSNTSSVLDPGTVLLNIPPNFRGNIIDLLSEIELLNITPDQAAKVVIDEEAGIIVMGGDIKISKVAIAQGNLTILIEESPQVSQALPFSPNGQTVEVPRSNIEVREEVGKGLTMVEGVSLQEVINGLNALGVGPRDLISILQNLKAVGALQAELEVL